jgi:molybdenum cofactor cytidylyltransferase
MRTAAIILAAGASTRMGQSKQRLPWKTGTLLSHAIQTARQSGVSSITVVLGADEEQNWKTIEGEKVNIVSNPRWQKGMGSSLKAGLKSVVKSNPNTDAILVMVCDQPFVTAEHLKALFGGFTAGTGQATVSRYSDTTGVPAVFGQRLFEKILSLNDEHGAKKLILQLREDEVSTVDLNGGEIDLDTWEQYTRFSEVLRKNQD